MVEFSVHVSLGEGGAWQFFRIGHLTKSAVGWVRSKFGVQSLATYLERDTNAADSTAWSISLLKCGFCLCVSHKNPDLAFVFHALFSLLLTQAGAWLNEYEDFAWSWVTRLELMQMLLFKTKPVETRWKCHQWFMALISWIAINFRIIIILGGASGHMCVRDASSRIIQEKLALHPMQCIFNAIESKNLNFIYSMQCETFQHLQFNSIQFKMS